MKTTLLALACGIGAVGCAARPARAPEGSTAPVIPILALDEAKDEWLHDRCAYRGMVAVDEDSIQGIARARGANLGEIVYGEGALQHIVLFRCASAPQWFAGNLPTVDDAAPAAPAVAPAVAQVVPAVQPCPPGWTVEYGRCEGKKEPPPPPKPPKPALGYVLVVSGVAAIAAGGVTGYMTMQAKDDVAAHCDAYRTCDAHGLDATSRGRTLSIVSTAAIGAGAVATGVGLYILLKPAKKEGTPTAVGARPVAGGGVLELEGRF